MGKARGLLPAAGYDSWWVWALGNPGPNTKPSLSPLLSPEGMLLTRAVSIFASFFMAGWVLTALLQSLSLLASIWEANGLDEE